MLGLSNWQQTKYLNTWTWLKARKKRAFIWETIAKHEEIVYLPYPFFPDPCQEKSLWRLLHTLQLGVHSPQLVHKPFPKLYWRHQNPPKTQTCTSSHRRCTVHAGSRRLSPCYLNHQHKNQCKEIRHVNSP